ncbi:MAG TPA: putative Ig domain-containing protein [Leptospiraceae bacterium]|nr:putative Ig domain-containing protein [Leptospiraceae bacterium]
MKLWTILIISVIGCSTEKNNDLKQNIFVSAVKSAKVTVTGKVAKGKISQARVDAYRLNADGTCNTGAGNLASALTDGSGDYTLTYTRTGLPICVIAVPNGNSKMYDEGTGTEIDWTGSTSLTMIMREPSGSTKTGMNITPFSRIIASRLATITKANKGTSVLDKQVTYSNKEIAVIFGFTKGFGKSVRADSSVIDLDKIEDVFDSGINLNDRSSSKSKYANALLGAVSVAAGKTKKSTKLTSDDVEKYAAALAEDIADGSANGTNSKGETLSVNGTVMGTTPLTGTLMTALTEYVSSNPSLGITSSEAGAVSFNQSPVFLQSLPVENSGGITLAYSSPSYSFPMGIAITPITPTMTGAITGCISSPSLPAGLTLNSTTCVISGTPTAFSPVTNYAITVGNSGGSAVASLNLQVTSDGSSWTTRTLPLSRDWQTVAYGNGIFAAITINSTTAATSADGINWTARTLPSSTFWQSITYGNGIFVVVSANSTSSSLSSADGINWTAGTLPSNGFWNSVAYGNGVFATLSSGTASAATSTDGINWTTRTLPVSQSWTSVTYGNGQFVAVSLNGALTSPDGITWTQRTISSINNYSVAYGNGMYVAVTGTSSNAAASSPDGINWTSRTLPASQYWSSVTYGNGIFVAVGNGSTTAAASTDGINWIAKTLPAAQTWKSVAYGNGVFVTVANGPTSSSASSP